MYEQNQNSSLSERVNLLKNEGYCGFIVKGSTLKYDEIEVIVENSEGKLLRGNGESVDEAYENVIEVIDYFIDNKG